MNRKTSVLLLGATGSLGSRLLSALLSRPSITVTAVVRNRAKLYSIVSASSSIISNQNHLSVEEGNATDASLIARIIREKNISVLVNAAGHAKMFSFSSNRSPNENEFARIVKASVDAVDQAAVTSENQKRIRGWFLGGMLLLDFPESGSGPDQDQGQVHRGIALDQFLPLYTEHRIVESTLRSANHLDWSLLCPAKMTPLRRFNDGAEQMPLLTACVDVPPVWNIYPLLRRIPFFGARMEIMMNSLRYTVTYEDVAEFITETVVREEAGINGEGRTALKGRYMERRVGLISLPPVPTSSITSNRV